MLNATGWYVARTPIDLRCGIDRLLAYVQAELGHDPRAGGAFVFCNRAATRIKVLCCDGQGVWLCVRRLHEGRFVWPRTDATVWTLTPEQFAWLCAGVNWQRLSRRVQDLPSGV